MLILDCNGVISFKGNPNLRQNLEDDIEQLQKGAELAGKGTKNDIDMNSFRKLDPAKCSEYLHQFSTIYGPSLQLNEQIRVSSRKMKKATCVMVFEENINVATD